jgi:hypothetical protein
MRILVTSVVLALMVAAAPRDCPGQTTIVFGTDDLSTSTVTTIDTGYFNGLPALLPAVLPADATFVPSFTGNLLSLQGKFWRYAFDLPHGFSDLAFSLSLRVNDEVAVYVNDQLVAYQSDTAIVPDPILVYSLVLNADGTFADTTIPSRPGWDGWNFLAIGQALFMEGTNEVTIYGTDTCCVPAGQIGGALSALSGQITFQGAETFSGGAGFASPFGSGPIRVKGHRVIPLKVELRDADGNRITDMDIVAPPVLHVMFDSGVAPAGDVTNEALPAGWGTEGGQFEFSDPWWQFNLNTKNYTSPGTYTVKMVSGDESEYVLDPPVQGQFVIPGP